MYAIQQLRDLGAVWTHPGHFAGEAGVHNSQITKKTFFVRMHLMMSPSKRHLCFFQDPPTFRVRPRPEYLQEVGRELIIPCEASGDPTPNVTWSKVEMICHS